MQNAKCKLQNGRLQNMTYSVLDGTAVSAPGQAAAIPFSRDSPIDSVGLRRARWTRVPTDNPQDIRDRTFRFACDVARLALGIAPRPGVRCLIDQLLRAATSVGANLEEAKAGSSKREFLRFVQIALRESREAVYWMRLCAELRLASPEQLDRLCNEGVEISRILGAIVVSTRRRMLQA